MFQISQKLNPNYMLLIIVARFVWLSLQKQVSDCKRKSQKS